MDSSLEALAAAVLHADRRPERILQIGCGEGVGVLFLAREFPSARVRGLDRSEQEVRAAVARVGLDPEGRVAFKVGDPSALPYPDDFFDLVAHRGGRPRLGEVVRVLRRGGDLIVLPKPERRLARGKTAWLRRGLARHGFEEIAAGDAGGRAFYVNRLNGGA